MTMFTKLHRITLAISCFCWATAVQAQETQLDYSLASPYETVITHLGFLEKGNYYPTIAAKAISQDHRSEEEAVAIALKLKELYEKEGIDIDITQLSKESDYIDSKVRYHRYQLTQLCPGIYLVKRGGKWLYSEETIQRMATLTSERQDRRNIDQVKKWLPTSFQTMFLDLYLWQYMVLALTLLLLVLIYRATILFMQLWLRYLSQRWSLTHLIGVERPIGLVVITLLMLLVLPAMHLPAAADNLIALCLQGVLGLTITILGYRSTSWLGAYLVSEHTAKEHDPGRQLALLIKPFLKVAVAILGTLLTLRSLGFDISTLLAGVSIGGVGVALASQDTLKNLFGSLMIFVDQPFVVGDLIATDSIQGQVEEIGLRSTRIRTPQDSLIYVPNAKLANTHIDNYGLRKYRRFDTRLAISYHTPPHLIEALVEGIRTIVKDHPLTRKDKYFVYLEDIKDSGLQILLSVYYKANNRDKELQYRHEVLSTMIKLVETLDIRLASPEQILHMASFPAKTHPLPVAHVQDLSQTSP